MEERLENFMVHQTGELQDIKKAIDKLNNGGMAKAIQKQNQRLVDQLVVLVKEAQKVQAEDEKAENKLAEKKLENQLEKWKLIAKILGGGLGINVAIKIFEWIGG
ncbi:MAG: hypothetical protein ACOCQD_02590 [archaeon]